MNRRKQRQQRRREGGTWRWLLGRIVGQVARYRVPSTPKFKRRQTCKLLATVRRIGFQNPCCARPYGALQDYADFLHFRRNFSRRVKRTVVGLIGFAPLRRTDEKVLNGSRTSRAKRLTWMRFAASAGFDSEPVRRWRHTSDLERGTRENLSSPVQGDFSGFAVEPCRRTSAGQRHNGIGDGQFGRQREPPILSRRAGAMTGFNPL